MIASAKQPTVALSRLFCAQGTRNFESTEASDSYSKLLKRARYALQLPTLPELPAPAEGVVPRAPEFPEYQRPVSHLAKRGVQVEPGEPPCTGAGGWSRGGACGANRPAVRGSGGRIGADVLTPAMVCVLARGPP